MAGGPGNGVTDDDGVKVEADGDPRILESVGSFVHWAGLYLSNTEHNYWLSRADMTQAASQCWKHLSEALGVSNRLSFRVLGDVLRLNGMALELRDGLMRAFAGHLAVRSVQGFDVLRGLSAEEMGDLLDVLGLSPEKLSAAGGFGEALKERGLEHVEVRTIVVREITEEETVVSKRRLAGLSTATGDQGEAEETILAYLRSGDDAGGGQAEAAGEVGEEGGNAAVQGIQASLEDGAQLARLVVEAARGEPVSGEATVSSDRVLVCLRRAFDGILQDPMMASPTGRRKLERAFRLMESEILDMLHAGSEGLDPGVIREVSDGIVTMADEYMIRSMAGEYARRREAIDRSERRLLRFLKSVGISRLREPGMAEKLKNAGLDVEGWRRLLAASGLQEGDEEGGELPFGGEEAVGRLAALLARLEAGAAASVGDGDDTEIHRAATDVQEEMVLRAAHAEDRIRELVSEVRADEAAAAQAEGEAESQGRPVRMTRRRLLRLLAEAVQELCQPLLVIQCSADTLISKMLGELTDPQMEMVGLAKESAERIKVLADNLMEIAGVPDELTPDAGIQEALARR